MNRREIYDDAGRVWTGAGWRDDTGRVWYGIDQTGQAKRYVSDVVCPGCGLPYGNDCEHARRYRDQGPCS